VTRSNVGAQGLDERFAIRRARAGNLDGDSLCVRDTITITGSSWVQTGSKTELRYKGGVNTSSCGSCGSRRCCSRSCYSRSSSAILNGLGLSSECSGSNRASYTRSTKVLESDSSCCNTSKLGCFGVVSRERYGNGRVVDGMSSCNIRVQGSNERIPVRRARAWNFNGYSLGIWNTVTVASARRIDSSGQTELWYESGINRTS